jgi:hypothetical protein
MTSYGPLKSSDLATLGDLDSVTIRVTIDLDDDLLDVDAWRPAAANRLHRDETGGRQLARVRVKCGCPHPLISTTHLPFDCLDIRSTVIGRIAVTPRA